MGKLFCRLVIVLVMAYMGITGTANAQENARYGIRLGLSLADISGDIDAYYAKTAIKEGVMFGISAAIPQGDRFFIQPEVYYVIKGTKNDTDAKEKLSLSYLEIPVLLRFVVIPQGPVRPSIFIGPAADLLLGAKYVYGTEDTDIMDFTNKMDASLIIGGGVDFPVGKHEIGLNVRYAHGFVNLNDTRGATQGLKVNNRAVSLILGYTF
ncbi:MAG: porin family protein [candidate division Zixibacteria bacterium]|nr:porin family protein [candidate division Zixibacteria bacterium]